jgi:putative transposase
LQRHITKLKKLDKYKFWNTVGSQAIQEITERIDKGYKKFFDNVKARKTGKTKERVRPPKFKKVKRYKSFTLKQAGWKVTGHGSITINKRGYKFSQSREILGTIKTVNVKRDAVGDFWISFSCELDFVPMRVMTGKIAGFDFGLKTFLTSSENEEDIKAPLFHKKALTGIKKANRRLSHKQKGSNQRKKAKVHLARVHRRVGWARDDYQWKLARELAIVYDHLFFENLCIKGMAKIWGRKIHDLGFDKFQKKLKSKAFEYNANVNEIDRFFPSSKKCCNCGNIKEELSLKDRIYKCDCGLVLPRDKNAAINIKMEGASSIGLEVRKPDIFGSFVGLRAYTPESPAFRRG